MRRGVVSFRIRRPNRLMRIFRRFPGRAQMLSALAFTAMFIYFSSTAESNLNGLWVRVESGAQLRLHHIGSRLVGTFTQHEGISFEAEFSSRNYFVGRVLLENIAACGGEQYFKDGYVAAISADGSTIAETWTGGFGDLQTCELWSTPREKTTLRRIE